MMKKNWSSIALIIAMTAFATTASAISLEFVSAPGPTNIGPYKLKIKDDVAIIGPPKLNALPNGVILAICNDISGGVPAKGTSWEVQKHALFNGNIANSGSLEKGAGATVPNPSTRAKFLEVTPLDVFLDATLADYKAGAWLANNMLAPGATVAVRTDNQQALWGLFKTDRLLSPTQAALKAAAYLAVAKGWNGWKSFALYTKVPLGTAPPGGTQEFYVKVPEAASFASLSLYFCGLGLLGYAFRRRIS